MLSLDVANCGRILLWSELADTTVVPQRTANTAGLCEPRFIPDICPYNPQGCLMLFLQTNSHSCPAHLGHPPLPARLKARLGWQSPCYRQRGFAQLFSLLLPFLALCRREALAVVSAARSSPCSTTSCRELPWLMDRADFFW